VAIKKIARAFGDPVDAKRILREIKLMRRFDHENVIRILDLLAPPPTTEEFEDIYIVQDLMETDLHRIIYSRQPLTIDHIQYFVYQMLRGLKYIHSANVLHRDLKVRMIAAVSDQYVYILIVAMLAQPSNILVNSNCDLKICDFGLARGVEDEQSGELTEYVVTRWYRAPEIMLACQDYSKAIDVWSVGCIFAELLARSPLFPGEDYIAQLRLICEKMGRPSERDLEFVTSECAKRFMLSLPDNKRMDMGVLFPAHKENTEALDLVCRMLDFHPVSRSSVDAALQHPFLSSLHNPGMFWLIARVFCMYYEFITCFVSCRGRACCKLHFLI
jgi:mitogen-activated protein kinase 1/3